MPAHSAFNGVDKVIGSDLWQNIARLAKAMEIFLKAFDACMDMSIEANKAFRSEARRLYSQALGSTRTFLDMIEKLSSMDQYIISDQKDLMQSKVAKWTAEEVLDFFMEYAGAEVATNAKASIFSGKDLVLLLENGNVGALSITQFQIECLKVNLPPDFSQQQAKIRRFNQKMAWMNNFKVVVEEMGESLSCGAKFMIVQSAESTSEFQQIEAVHRDILNLREKKKTISEQIQCIRKERCKTEIDLGILEWRRIQNDRYRVLRPSNFNFEGNSFQYTTWGKADALTDDHFQETAQKIQGEVEERGPMIGTLKIHQTGKFSDMLEIEDAEQNKISDLLNLLSLQDVATNNMLVSGPMKKISLLKPTAESMQQLARATRDLAACHGANSASLVFCLSELSTYPSAEQKGVISRLRNLVERMEQQQKR